MDYKKIHDNIITRAKNRIFEEYTEVHHIIPRSLGGSDDASNLVNLTPEEHYLVHQLLVKIYLGNPKLIFAANMMCSNRPNNKLYGWLRRRLSQQLKDNNPNKGGTARRNYNKKFGSPNKGWHPNAETRQILREMKLGDKNPRFGNPGTMRTTTYLVNAETKQVDYTFETLEAAEEFLKVNHTTVWYNRKRNRPHKGYYWCVGETELENLRENNERL